MKSTTEFPNLPNNDDHNYYDNDEESTEQRSQPLLDDDQNTQPTYEGDHLLDYDIESSSSEDKNPMKFNIEFNETNLNTNNEKKDSNTNSNHAAS